MIGRPWRFSGTSRTATFNPTQEPLVSVVVPGSPVGKDHEGHVPGHGQGGNGERPVLIGSLAGRPGTHTYSQFFLFQCGCRDHSNSPPVRPSGPQAPTRFSSVGAWPLSSGVLGQSIIVPRMKRLWCGEVSTDIPIIEDKLSKRCAISYYSDGAITHRVRPTNTRKRLCVLRKSGAGN